MFVGGKPKKVSHDEAKKDTKGLSRACLFAGSVTMQPRDTSSWVYGCVLRHFMISPPSLSLLDSRSRPSLSLSISFSHVAHRRGQRLPRFLHFYTKATEHATHAVAVATSFRRVAFALVFGFALPSSAPSSAKPAGAISPPLHHPQSPTKPSIWPIGMPPVVSSCERARASDKNKS